MVEQTCRVWVLSVVVALVGCGDDGGTLGNQLTVSQPVASTPEDTPLTVTIESNSPLAAFQFSVAVPPMHGAITGSGQTWTYTPDADYNGPDTATVSVTDGQRSASAIISITVTPVNDAPIVGADAINAAQDTPLDINPNDLISNDTDIEGDTLTLVSVQNGTNGTVSTTSSSAVQGITFTPQGGFVGTATFRYTISDGTTTANGMVNVTVAPDAAPVANDDSAITAEDTATSLDVLANDTDPDNDTLVVISSTQPANGTTTRVGGVVTYTPSANFHGADGFSYVVSDGKGKVDTGTVAITVTPVNDPPVAVNDSRTTPEDTGTTISVALNDTDVDGDTLTVTGNTPVAHGTLALGGNVFTYTPALNYFGPDSFTYTISDGNGGSATGTVSLTVTSVNDAPVATNDTATTAEDTTVMLSPQLNDTDVDGDMLALQSVGTPLHGAIALVGTTVNYTPALNYNGPDSFTYVVSDGHGGTATGTVQITVTPVNDAPFAGTDTASPPEDVALSIPVLANDTDVDGDTLSISTFTQPTFGTVTQSGNMLVYTGYENYYGPDGFTYTATDGNGGFATAVVHITVTPVNDAPIARPDVVGLESNTQIDVNVVANDIDVENHPLSLIAVTPPMHGTATIVGNQLRYIPTLDYVGDDFLTYTINDGNGGTASALVTITVVEASICGDGYVTGTEECEPGQGSGSGSIVADNSIPGQPPTTLAAVPRYNGCNANCTFACGSGTGAAQVEIDYSTQNCYALYTSQVDHASATSACTTAGGHLASIAQSSEQYTVFYMQFGGVWLGMTGNGTLAWQTGETVGYTNWAPGQPNMMGPACVAMQQGAPGVQTLGTTHGAFATTATTNSGFGVALGQLPQDPGAWDDLSCSTPMNYVCEFDAGLYGHGGTALGLTGELVLAMTSPDPFARQDFELYSCSSDEYAINFLADGKSLGVDIHPGGKGDALHVHYPDGSTWAEIVSALNNYGANPMLFTPPLTSLATLTVPSDGSIAPTFDALCTLELGFGQPQLGTCYNCDLGQCDQIDLCVF